MLFIVSLSLFGMPVVVLQSTSHSLFSGGAKRLDSTVFRTAAMRTDHELWCALMRMSTAFRCMRCFSMDFFRRRLSNLVIVANGLCE